MGTSCVEFISPLNQLQKDTKKHKRTNHPELKTTVHLPTFPSLNAVGKPSTLVTAGVLMKLPTSVSILYMHLNLNYFIKLILENFHDKSFFSKKYKPYIIGKILNGSNKIKFNDKINWW